MPSESLAILLTRRGPAAIAVIRLTGPLAEPFIASHFSRATLAGRCVHGTLVDHDGHVIDDPVVTTQKHSIDLNVHGGPWVVQSVLALAVRDGFVVTEPTSRLPPVEAVDADSALEAEMLRHLPLAQTELSLSMLLGQASAWRELRGHLLVAASDGGGAAEIAEMIGDESLMHLLHPPRVAIVGVPNVGKSTLANALFAREASITADVAGTTRDWVGELANLDGLAVMLLDTPGIRTTDDPVEAGAINRATGEISAADLVLLVLDVTQPFDGAQADLVARFPNAMHVFNKTDEHAVWHGMQLQGIATVATSGQGIDAVCAAVRDWFGIHRRPLAAPRWWTTEQLRVLQTYAKQPEAIAAWIETQLAVTE